MPFPVERSGRRLRRWWLRRTPPLLLAGEGWERGSAGRLMTLSHLDEHGRARMVDVGAKADTARVATARGRVHMQPATLALVLQGNVAKGDVIAVARLAGIMAAKRTGELIPLC